MVEIAAGKTRLYVFFLDGKRARRPGVTQLYLRLGADELKLKQRRLADGGRRLVYIGHARKLHHETVLSSADNTPFLHLHDRLRDAKRVDTRLYHIAQDAHRAGDLRALYSRDIRFIHQTAPAGEVKPELEIKPMPVSSRRIDEIPDQNAENEHDKRPKDEYGVRDLFFRSILP